MLKAAKAVATTKGFNFIVIILMMIRMYTLLTKACHRASTPGLALLFKQLC
jgi:hypothetical protein